MNNDWKLGVLSMAALCVALVVSFTVLVSDPDPEGVNTSKVDSQILAGTEKAEAIKTDHDTSLPFHWMFESIVRIERRL